MSPQDDDTDFEAWMKQVDQAIAKKLNGLTSTDLPDHTYRDDFEGGASAEDVADEVVEAAEGG